MTFLGIDPVTNQPRFGMKVVNVSHWGSGTRVPAPAQAAGLPPRLIADTPRGSGLGIGGDYAQSFEWEQEGAYSTQPQQVGVDQSPTVDYSKRSPDDPEYDPDDRAAVVVCASEDDCTDPA
jgi:hypothetical protein